jgi:hypothetical protein
MSTDSSTKPVVPGDDETELIDKSHILSTLQCQESVISNDISLRTNGLSNGSETNRVELYDEVCDKVT